MMVSLVFHFHIQLPTSAAARSELLAEDKRQGRDLKFADQRVYIIYACMSTFMNMEIGGVFANMSTHES